MDKKWLAVCVFGGILMIIGSVAGDVTVYRMIFDFIEEHVTQDYSMVFSIILTILGVIAAGGGFTVLVGTGVIASGHSLVGKIVIALGAGMGIIGLIIMLVTGAISGTLMDRLFSIGPGFVGVLLTIIARLKL